MYGAAADYDNVTVTPTPRFPFLSDGEYLSTATGLATVERNGSRCSAAAGRDACGNSCRSICGFAYVVNLLPGQQNGELAEMPSCLPAVITAPSIGHAVCHPPSPRLCA
jgi:hypothetical protein